MSRTPLYPDQVVPLALTSVICAAGIAVLGSEILLLNRFVGSTHIVPTLRWPDIVVGITIYLKTSIDFAIFIGRLMTKYPGWKNRIMIEIGTAIGNILGTLGILLLWDLFREVKPLLAVMIALAALVLLRMAEEGLEHVPDSPFKKALFTPLHGFNSLVAPFLNRIVPATNMKDGTAKGLRGLFLLAITVPFILGLDDFAGYVPLFSIVNVFGFATGVFVGHMLLNIALFLSPRMTIKAVKNPLIAFFGSLAFVGLALWGLLEAGRLIVGL